MDADTIRGSLMQATILAVSVAVAATSTACRASKEERAEPVRIFAAASAAAALAQAIASGDSEAAPRVSINAASSATLARQIEAGAPADIYVSADGRWVRYLADRGLLGENGASVLFSNTLVFASPRKKYREVRADAEFDFAAAFSGCVATGDPSSVPLGIYARQTLERLGWWAALRPRIVGAQDAVAAANLVARDQCDVGILYSSDARAFDEIVVDARIPEALHDPISYWIAAAVDASPAAADLIRSLRSPAAVAVFEGFGFRVHGGPAAAN